MRRLSFITLAALVLLAVVALAGAGRPQAAHADVAAPGTVTTIGDGSVSAVPDVATVTAGVRTSAATAAAALAANATKMNAVVAALKHAGGSELQTQQVSLDPQTNDKNAVTGYVAQNTVSAKVKIAGAGALIDAAVNAGANTVEGPSLDLSDRDALYLEALKQAVTDAHAKAQALADAGGFAVGQVTSVTENGDNTPPVFQGTAVAKSAGSTPVEPGTQDVTAEVTVSFAIR
jgi:uncharacterized protein